MNKKANYIICYDISDTKRLQRLARTLEKQAIRIQHSIFYAEAVGQATLFEIIDSISDIIDDVEDDVRVYTIIDSGDALGRAVDLDNSLLYV